MNIPNERSIACFGTVYIRFNIYLRFGLTDVKKTARKRLFLLPFQQKSA